MNYRILFFLVFIVFFSLEISATTRIGIISDRRWCGEREVGWRIKIAAESLGWEAFLDEERGEYLNDIEGLDWVICLLPQERYNNRTCPKYQTIFHPFGFLDETGQLVKKYEECDGYLLTVKKPYSFETAFRSINKELFFIPFYPTVQKIEYKKSVLKNLMTMIPVWSERVTDTKYKTLYNLLSQSGFTRFYGIFKNKDMISKGFMGKIPFDGISVVKVLQRHGIVLIIHSDIHNQENIPSSRIFEATAASAVVISDQNAFVKKHFGDSVFYIDTSLSAEEIYQQIEGYMNQIRLNPEKALEMAANAHQIYEDNFLMTDQLIRLNAMNQEVIKKMIVLLKNYNDS